MADQIEEYGSLSQDKPADSSELAPLNPNIDPISTKTDSFNPIKWELKHTISVLIIRLLIDFLFKNPFLFYQNYAESLGINDNEFGYILIFSEIGAIIALLVNYSKIMKKFLHNSIYIFIIYSFIGGVSSVLFTVPEYFKFHNQIAVVLYCGACRFFTGLSFAFLSAETIKLCL